jgi:hypothetical protein
MTARVYRPEFDQSRFDSAQVGGDYYRELAERFLIPQIKQRNKQALNVVPEFFRFYQRAYTGRRCSCFSLTETAPSPACLVCFGTGNTAGFQLYGHVTEVFDATAESAGVGIVLDFDVITRPLRFRLVKNALRGHLDFTLNVRGGLNVCTLASVAATASRGARVRTAVKLFSEPNFTALSVDAVTARLQQAQTQGGLHLRVYMERDSISVPSPTFSHMRIRYKTLDDDRLSGDVPLITEGTRSSEFGSFEEAETRNLFLDATLRTVTNEDLFRQVNTGRLWKVFSVRPNYAGGTLLSWDLNTTLIQNTSRYANLP